MKQYGKASAFLARHGMEPTELSLPAVTAAFVDEMEAGLAGSKSSLDMIPTYLACGSPEPGRRAAVIDAGGTNFRASRVLFTERGAEIEYVERSPMPGTEKPASWQEFIDYSAHRLYRVMDGSDALGFCFSFRAEITPERDGRVIAMSKGVELTGYEGRLICSDVTAALGRLGAPQPPAVLVNDTTAVLLSGASLLRTEGYDSLIGLVCGTGQNTCCVVDTSRIGKISGADTPAMLVNLESGCFDGCPRGDFDMELDAATVNPNDHLLEKMTSGAYLGELCRLTLKGAAREGLLTDEGAERVHSIAVLTSADADELATNAPRLFSKRDAALIRELCHAVFSRAAMCVCANLSAILILTDKGADPARPACICADGSVIRRSRAFSSELSHYLDSFTRAVLGRHTVLRCVEDSTTLGTAAAALINR